MILADESVTLHTVDSDTAPLIDTHAKPRAEHHRERVQEMTRKPAIFAAMAIIALASLAMTTPATAGIIGSAYSEAIDPDGVGFEWTINQDDTTDELFKSVITNTSPTQTPENLIDRIAFTLDPTAILGTDFSISNVAPNWIFSPAAGGVQFDFVGDRTDPASRLGIGESLVFDILFTAAYFDLATNGGLDTYAMFLNAPVLPGTGLGGGDVSGQLGASFQQLGPQGEASEFIATSWQNDPSSDGVVPEPSSLAMFASLALIPLITRRRRRK